MAPSVPPSLKKIKAFLARAEELDHDKNNPESRVVAYNCRQYAVLQGIPLAGPSDAEAKQCLGNLLSQLEKEKGAMSVFNKAEHWKISRKVADKVFDKADSEDRAGVANKSTAKSFYAAGTFYEILQQFHPQQDDEQVDNGGEDGDGESKEMVEEEAQRRVYCKWKATEILKDIKEGRAPTPGGYKQEEEQEDLDVGVDDYGLPTASLPASDMNGGGGLPSIREASQEDVLPLPPAPSMPTSDFYNTTNDETETNEQSAETDGVEVSVNDDGDDDIFIPGAAKQAADNITGINNNSLFVDDDTPSAPTNPPPPPYLDNMSAIPPPASSKPLPPVAPAPSNSSSSNSSSSKGVFSSMFGKSSSSAKSKLSKDEMGDAVELTKFALAALQHGDGELGRQRLEQALGIWRR